MISVSGTESLEHDEITGSLSLTSSTIIVSVVLDDWSPITISHNQVNRLFVYQPSSYAITVRLKDELVSRSIVPLTVITPDAALIENGKCGSCKRYNIIALPSVSISSARIPCSSKHNGLAIFSSVMAYSENNMWLRVVTLQNVSNISIRAIKHWRIFVNIN